jgi:hypothetical protein
MFSALFLLREISLNMDPALKLMVFTAGRFQFVGFALGEAPLHFLHKLSTDEETGYTTLGVFTAGVRHQAWYGWHYFVGRQRKRRFKGVVKPM